MGVSADKLDPDARRTKSPCHAQAKSPAALHLRKDRREARIGLVAPAGGGEVSNGCWRESIFYEARSREDRHQKMSAEKT